MCMGGAWGWGRGLKGGGEGEGAGEGKERVEVRLFQVMLFLASSVYATDMVCLCWGEKKV